MGRYRQQKSLIDWKNSEGPIKELLNTNKYYKKEEKSRSMTRTWINEATEWTKKNKLKLTGKKEVKEQLKEQFEQKKRLNPQCKIQDFRNKFKIEGRMMNLRKELNSKTAKGSRLLIEIRTGTHPNRLKLVGRGDISGMWHSKCLICEETAPDEYCHWITNCKSLENLRKNHIDNLTRIMKATEGEEWGTKMQSIMLKGKTRLKCPMDIINKEQRNIDEFNNKLYDIRMKAITEAKNKHQTERHKR
ncbi:hypothetical protein GINT2_000356 [Glugoides intestinalis]